MASKVTAPDGSSRADALERLWGCSRPARFFQTISHGEDLRKKQEAAAWASKQKVEEMLQKNPYVDYHGGRCIKTDFSKYPAIDLASFKQRCSIPGSFAEIYDRCVRRPPPR